MTRSEAWAWKCWPFISNAVRQARWRLQVVDNYSPTSAYVIDADGIIRAPWLGSIHERVGPEAIIEGLKKLATGAASVPERNRAGKP